MNSFLELIEPKTVNLVWLSKLGMLWLHHDRLVSEINENKKIKKIELQNIHFISEFPYRDNLAQTGHCRGRSESFHHRDRLRTCLDEVLFSICTSLSESFRTQLT